MSIEHRGDGFGRVYRADGVYLGLVWPAGDFWACEDRAGESVYRATEADCLAWLAARCRIGKGAAA